MAALRRDGFTLPTDDLASDDIVMTSSRGRPASRRRPAPQKGFRVDRAVSLARAGVSTPTSAIKGEAGTLVPQRSGRAMAVSTVMPGSQLRHASTAVIRPVIKRDDKRRFSAIRAGTRPRRKPSLTCTDRDALVRLVTRNCGVQVPPPTPSDRRRPWSVHPFGQQCPG